MTSAFARHPRNRRNDIQCACPLIHITGHDGAIRAAAVDGAFGGAPRDADADGGADDAGCAGRAEGRDADGDGLADCVADGMGEGAFGAGFGLAGNGADDVGAVSVDEFVRGGYGFLWGLCCRSLTTSRRRGRCRWGWGWLARRPLLRRRGRGGRTSWCGWV